MRYLRILAVLGFMLVSNASFSQRANDVFNTSLPITWLGLDFSQARFIGDYYKFTSIHDAKNLIDALNDLMIKEPEKFDVAKMLGKKEAILRVDITQKHNNALDLALLLADSTGQHNHLKKEDIETIVKFYDFKGLKGLGVMINVETFNRKIPMALVWVTFVNIGTGEVIFTEKLEQPPAGFGIRNYWAGAIYETMVRVRKKELKKWQLLYMNK